MLKTFKSLLLATTLGLVYTSCKKIDIPAAASPSRVVEEEANLAGLTPYPFAWETANFMPTPPGISIGVPWGSGSNQTFSPDIALDFNSNEGWVLVYNTFNTTALTSPKYFMLYNKFRGLLRMYLYLDPNTPNPSTYITHTLSLASVAGATSSILNYAGTDVVDVSANRLSASEIQQYQIISTGSWYVFQYEMAYDQNISNLSYQNLNLNWSAGSTSITQVNLAGQINGTLNGTIGTPAAPVNILGQLGNGVLMFTGKAVLNNNPTLLPAKIMTAAKDAIDKGLQGVVKNVFNGIFGGNSSNVEQVNLSLNAKMNITGTLQNSSGLLFNTFAIPGTANSQNAPLFSPGYTDRLGVFNISARPKVKVTSIKRTPPANWDGPASRYFDNTFAIVPSSFSFIYNPAVTSSATIQVLEQKVFLPEYTADPINHFYAYNAQTEQVGESVYYFAGGIVDGTKILPGAGLAAVRVVLKVTPNNGAPASTIVKTFLADITL